MTSLALVTQSEGKLMEFERILNRKLELCWLEQGLEYFECPEYFECLK